MLGYILILVLVCLIVWLLKEPAGGVPALPGKLPIIGHGWSFIGDSEYVLKRIKDTGEEITKLGGVMRVYFGPKVIYAITDPDDAATVLLNCLERPFFYDLIAPILGEESIFCSKVNLWKQHRKALNPAFSLKSLHKFMDVFNEQGRRLVQQLEAHGPGPFDHFHTILLNNLEITLQTILGYDIEELGDECEKFMTALEKALEIVGLRLFRVWLYNNFIYSFSSLKKEQDKHMEFIHKILETALNRKIQQRKSNSFEINVKSQTRNCILDHILDEGSSQFQTYKQIRDNLDILVGASYDTTATASTYFMTVVGSYPDVQQKIYEEITAVVGDNDDVTKDDLSKLVYMEAVIKESLRLYAVSPAIARETVEDIKLKNYTIPKNSIMVILMMNIHRHPVWGPDADQFVPERWLDTTRLPRNMNVYTPFSLGKRNCIGKTYAMMSMKTSLVHVLRHYKVTADITKTEHKFDIIMKPASGHHITLEQRNKTSY